MTDNYYEPTKEGRQKLILDALEIFGSGVKIYVRDKKTGREWPVTGKEAEEIRAKRQHELGQADCKQSDMQPR